MFLTEQAIFGRLVKLRSKTLADARNDYTWQTDPELAQLDAAVPARVSFQGYLLDFTHQLRNPGSSRRLFAVDTLESRHIGNCSYYNIDRCRQEAELGIMIGDRGYWGKSYGTDAVTTLLDYIFRETDLNNIYLKTLDWNYRAQSCFKKCGFVVSGFLYQDGYSFLRMNINRKQWDALRNSGEPERCLDLEGGGKR